MREGVCACVRVCACGVCACAARVRVCACARVRVCGACARVRMHMRGEMSFLW